MHKNFHLRLGVGGHGSGVENDSGKQKVGSITKVVMTVVLRDE